MLFYYWQGSNQLSIHMPKWKHWKNKNMLRNNVVTIYHIWQYTLNIYLIAGTDWQVYITFTSCFSAMFGLEVADCTHALINLRCKPYGTKRAPKTIIVHN